MSWAAHKGLNSRNLFGQFSAGDLRVMGCLGTEPVTRAQSQKTAKAHIRDAGTSMDLASRY